jgi:uncharacterized protein (DUF2336 family)
MLQMEVGARYSKLLELAHENSSEKRRELLNDVTDLFFATSDVRSPIESDMFGELMTKVAYELDSEVRKTLSTRMAQGNAPRRLALALANDNQLDVAAPIIRHSLSLSQEDLIAVVESKDDEHRMLVTGRPDVSEALSAALVSFGNDKVVASLIGNEQAKVSDATFTNILDRAAKNPELNRPLVNRQSIPPEHLNKLYASVDADLRTKILERNASYSEAQIEEALQRAKTQISIDCGALPADFDTANERVEQQKRANSLLPSHLPSLWRDKNETQFFLSFATLTGLDFHQSKNLFQLKDLDTIAMVCRAANFERALFVTVAVLALGENGMGKAKVLGEMYHNVPHEAAQRAVRFMKLRTSAIAQAA